MMGDFIEVYDITRLIEDEDEVKISYNRRKVMM